MPAVRLVMESCYCVGLIPMISSSGESFLRTSCKDFGNYEGLLPEKEDRDYYECDINTDGSYRGAERIVFSNDGLIYYTPDHYETFELLYGEE